MTHTWILLYMLMCHLENEIVFFLFKVSHYFGDISHVELFKKIPHSFLYLSFAEKYLFEYHKYN